MPAPTDGDRLELDAYRVGTPAVRLGVGRAPRGACSLELDRTAD